MAAEEGAQNAPQKQLKHTPGHRNQSKRNVLQPPTKEPKKEQSSVAVAFDAQRTIHTLDALGKSCYKHLLNKSGAKNSCSKYEYAYVKGRRRENAIKQQNIMSMRLKAAKISYITTSYDMRNAFGSVHFKIMEQVFRYSIAVEDWALFKQRIYCTSTSVPGLENKKHFEIGSGPFQGDQIAADLFRITFKKALENGLKVMLTVN